MRNFPQMVWLRFSCVVLWHTNLWGLINAKTILVKEQQWCYITYIWKVKRLEKKLDGNYTRMLRAILNKSWRQHPTRRQMYGHLPPITKTIQIRRARHAGHCWRSKDELVSDVLLWTPSYGQAKAGRPARTYIQQLCEDTGCNPEDLPEAMNDREKWRERVRDIRAGGMTWWWWWWSSIPSKNISQESFEFLKNVSKGTVQYLFIYDNSYLSIYHIFYMSQNLWITVFLSLTISIYLLRYI